MKKTFFLVLICFVSSGFCEDLFTFPSQEIAQLEIETSFPIENLSDGFQNYIKQDVYPQTQPYYIDLRYTELSEKNNLELVSEDILNSYFDYFFSATDAYIYALNQDDSRNEKNLECLLLQEKKVLLFVNVTANWNTSSLQPIEDSGSNVIGTQGFFIVGFDHHSKYFIAKTCWGKNIGENGYIFLSYEYVKQHALCSFYEQISAATEEVRNVTLNVTKWDVGGGNIFTPKAKINGDITGHPAFIKWLRIVVEYSSKKRVVLKQIIVKPGDTFAFREKYTRLGSRYCSLECTNNDFEVTRFIKRKIE